MSDVLDDVEPVTAPSNGDAPGERWQTDKNGKEYIARGGGKVGTIYRKDGESIEHARERDAKAHLKRPQRAPKRPKMPDPPRKADLKELEAPLAAALKAPAAICMTAGDEWGALHFQRSGPFLARTLINAAEFNPWLRQKLESAASGEEAMMMVMGMMGITGALVGYAVPPIIYYLNLNVPQRARDMWDIPPRKERQPAYAAGTTPTDTAEEQAPLAA